MKEIKLWLSFIPRDNMPEYKDTAVSEDHWPTDYPKVIYYGKKRLRDPSSDFLCVKKSLIPPKPLHDRTTCKAHPSSRNSQPGESNHFNQLISNK